MTILDSQLRGDPFVYTGTLGNGWVFADFTGGLKFTLRTEIPESTVTTDTDAVDQASSTSLEPEITGGGTTVTITIPSERTDAWPKGRLHWDLQGTITGATPAKRTIDRGTILIVGDVTRS
jgi:hypothetical protein